MKRNNVVHFIVSVLCNVLGRLCQSISLIITCSARTPARTPGAGVSGDSRTVLVGDIPIPMSFDHKLDNRGEAARIRAAGGFVHNDGYGALVNNILSLSRAFGDFESKFSTSVKVEIISKPRKKW